MDNGPVSDLSLLQELAVSRQKSLDALDKRISALQTYKLSAAPNMAVVYVRMLKVSEARRRTIADELKAVLAELDRLQPSLPGMGKGSSLERRDEAAALGSKKR